MYIFLTCGLQLFTKQEDRSATEGLLSGPWFRVLGVFRELKMDSIPKSRAVQLTQHRQAVSS